MSCFVVSHRFPHGGIKRRRLKVVTLPPPMESGTRYILHVLRAQGLTCESTLRGSDPKLYVTVKVADTKKATPVIERNTSPKWNASLTFSAPDTACVLKLQVKHRSTWPSDPCIAYVEIELGELMQSCESGEAVLDLLFPHKKSSRSRATAGTISLELKTADLVSSVEIDVNNIQQTVNNSGIKSTGSSTTLSRVDNVSQLADGSDLYKSIGDLFKKLDIIVNIIDDVSEVNTYLKVAWDLTSLLYKSVANVFKVDKKAVELARALDETFDFVNETHTLRNKTRVLEPQIIKLLKTTCDCCQFLEKYLPRGFVGRMFSLDASERIDGFMQSVKEQKNDLNLGLTIHNAAIAARTSEKIDELFLQHRLNILNAVPAARQPCLEDTRVKDRRDIIDLLQSETGPGIVWLHGVAGSGKSTIATSIEDYFRDMSQLGAFLKFERGKSDPGSVVRELAFKLALFDSSTGSRIIQQVEQEKDIASALLSRQFERLLLQPLSAAAAAPPTNPWHPVIIVLDGLDECGTPETRTELMRLLENEFPKLPSAFHFLITSRAEPDIVKALPKIVREIALDYTSDTSRRDVLSYLHYEMPMIVNARCVVKPPGDWSWNDNLSVLSEAAGGLFIWASTAVKLVSMSDNPFWTLKNLVSDSRLVVNFGLDNLYEAVLKGSGIVWENDRSRTRFSSVLALLLFSKIPLSNEDIDGLLGFPPDEPSDLILSRLRCLLSYAPGEPVRLFHASFSDYLQSAERTGDPWFLDISHQKTHLAMRCFAVMEGSLHFNMGDLDTSFIRNYEVQGLEDRIKVKIPLPLEYACTYWAQHLVEVPTSSRLLDALSDFAYHRLLFWFEVLSLQKVFRRITSRALPDAASWVTRNTAISSFLKDACSLATVFADPISQSTPHIYVSMLPLTSGDSEVSAHYSRWMSSMVRVGQRGMKPKPMWLKVLEGHSDVVNTVCFSPDGRHIISGSYDETVRVWDTDSGELACAPLKGHKWGVFSVAVSTDGQCISSVSYSGAIRAWDLKDRTCISCLRDKDAGRDWPKAFSSDARYLVTVSDDGTRLRNIESGNAVLLPFIDRIEHVSAIAVSPTGMVATGFKDGTMILWDMDIGMVDSQLLKGDGNRIVCITFSPDAARIALVYDDKTIRVWDVTSGEVVSGPFVGHTYSVTCVAFSPDGQRVASGSEDKTVIIWDVQTGKADAGPFIGHSGPVTSVAFSPDGSRIVSGSVDQTVRVWDVSTVSNVTATSNENTSRIRIVAFSPDDSKIVSVSHYATMRVWDVGGEPSISRCFEGCNSFVLSLAFSPDGSYVISGSLDGTIRVWELSTGAVVSGPHKAHAAGVKAISISPDGTCIVSASSDTTVRIWDWTTGAANVVAGPITGDAKHISTVALSPDASRAVYGTDGGELILRDVRSGDVILESYQGNITFVVFSPDSRYFASCGYDGIRVGNATTGDLVSELSGWFSSIAFSPDVSKIAASSFETVSLYDVMTGQLTAGTLKGHRGWINSVAFSHDGRHAVSGSEDYTIRLWDVEAATLAYGSPDDEDMTSWTLTPDGWIINGKEELLLWIPPVFRDDLLPSHNTAMFSCAFWTNVDFRNANIGTRWRDCFKPA